MKRGIMHEDVYHGGEPDNNYIDKVGYMVLLIGALYLAFQFGRWF